MMKNTPIKRLLGLESPFFFLYQNHAATLQNNTHKQQRSYSDVEAQVKDSVLGKGLDEQQRARLTPVTTFTIRHSSNALQLPRLFKSVSHNQER